MLKNYIKKMGITQKQFADQLHISKSYMCMLVHRKRRPSAKLAKKIARATHKKVTIMWLLYGD